jgi:hypothetical protein
VSSIPLPALYKVSFLFDLIFKKAIAVSGVYNLVDLSLIVFFIITAVFGLNSYRRLRWLVLTWQQVVCVWPKKRSLPVLNDFDLTQVHFYPVSRDDQA